MLPILLDLGLLKIYTFGVFLILAFFWGSYFLWRLVQLTSYKEDKIFDGLILAIFGGLFFGRLMFVILHFADFGFDFTKFILVNGYPGINFLGALLGSNLTLYFFASQNKLRFSELADYFIPPLMTALAIGKVGAFFAGSEVGSQTYFFLRLKYANFDGLRHLTAFYEGILIFIGTYLAYRLLFDVRRQLYPSGFVFLFFWWYIGLTLTLFSNFKANQDFIAGLNLNFLIGFIILLTLTIYFLYYLRVLIVQRCSQFIRFFRFYAKAKKQQKIG